MTITQKAWPCFSDEGLTFFTERRWAPNDDVYGALSFIYGTVLTATIAVVVAVPVSLGIALFITQVAPRVAAPSARQPHRPASPWCRRWCSACGASSSSPRSCSGFYDTIHGWFGGLAGARAASSARSAAAARS